MRLDDSVILTKSGRESINTITFEWKKEKKLVSFLTYNTREYNQKQNTHSE